MSRTVANPLALSVPLEGALRGGAVLHVVLVALAVLMAVPVTGQTVTASFDELRSRVKAGETVYITEGGGQSEQEARVLDVSASSLVVWIGGVRRELGESNVTRIRQRLPDSKKNGALIGLLVGAAGSTAGAKAMESPAGSCGGGCVAANVLYGGGLGALIGLGIDALIERRKDVYVKGAGRSSQDIVVRPAVTAQRKGFEISVRF